MATYTHTTDTSARGALLSPQTPPAPSVMIQRLVPSDRPTRARARQPLRRARVRRADSTRRYVQASGRAPESRRLQEGLASNVARSPLTAAVFLVLTPVLLLAVTATVEDSAASITLLERW
jgi:hypothetical protein